MSDQESRQDRKYRLSLAGEFLVAGELLRRGMQAAVTYGNAKKADVIAICGDRAIPIEVKTTQNDTWVVGQKVPEDTGQIWIFTFLPDDARQSPDYYILTGHELNTILTPRENAYFERYQAKHGKPYGDRPGVCNCPKSLITDHNGAWDKVKRALNVGS
jgi:hypothetical protein